MKTLWSLLILVFCWLGTVPSVSAHEIPRSQVEVRIGAHGAEVTLTFSVLGFALDYPAMQLSKREREKVAQESRTLMADAVATRFGLLGDNQVLVPNRLTPQESAFLPERNVIRLHLTYPWQKPPRRLEVQGGRLFPVDPNHTVFVVIYAQPTDSLVGEAILNRATPSLSYAIGREQSALFVIQQFVREGVHHIFIGPDHILFIIGLLLLGGGAKHLLKIVTAFTLAHSITLALATVNIVDPSPRLIEPAIALSIIFVGVHGLSQLWGSGKQHDLRLPLAFCFGLVHGFGFASVLRELELPREALGLSLFSFNLGVELGQACIVSAIVPLLTTIARRNQQVGKAIVIVGLGCVVLAGAFWFGQRLK